MSRNGCPLCRERKAKRHCPAKDAAICSLCCGRKRLVEIDCPSDCAYLSGAHAGSWSGRENERQRDVQRLAPHFAGLGRDQASFFAQALTGLAALRRRRRDLDDGLLLDALGALLKTAETLRSGIVYEHAAEDPQAQAVLVDLRELFEARNPQGQRVDLDERDRVPILSALEEAVRQTIAESAGPSAFLDTAARFARELRSDASPQQQTLIVPP